MGAGGNPARSYNQQRPYRCFLVRCRLEETPALAGDPVWRFSVEETGPRAARRAFTCLEDFQAYLEAEFGLHGAPAP